MINSVAQLGQSVLLGLAVGGWLVAGCSSESPRPSLVDAGGSAGQAGRPATSGGSEQAGLPDQAGGSAGDIAQTDSAGAAGESPGPAPPLALFPSELAVDVGCSEDPMQAPLLIQNRGALPLVITRADANSGYVVSGVLPLTIAPKGSGTLLVTPPLPTTHAVIGDTTTGVLSFETNEPGSPSHQVSLNTTLFGATLEFTDAAGTPIRASLPLTYLSSSLCPDDVRYRVHNTGNVTFTLLGPTFPAHFGGTTAGEMGLSVAPNDFAELSVGGNSAPGNVCSASGVLSFSVEGAFCGAVPTLSVSWPSNAEASCDCTAAAE